MSVYVRSVYSLNGSRWIEKWRLEDETTWSVVDNSCKANQAKTSLVGCVNKVENKWSFLWNEPTFWLANENKFSTTKLSVGTRAASLLTCRG